MASIVKVLFSNESELVPIWSAALSKEILKLKEINKDIIDIEVINLYATKEECEYFDSLVKRTKYTLPKEYRKTRQRRVKNDKI